MIELATPLSIPSTNGIVIVDQLVLSLSADMPICRGDTGTIYLGATGGSGYYTFTNANGNIVESPLNALPGTYSFHVQDSYGCTADETTTIIVAGIFPPCASLRSQ